MAIILKDDNFENQISSQALPVLVDFFSSWCEPCAMIEPVLAKIAEDFEGKLVLAKANLDDCPMIAQKFGINQIPTVVLFDKEKPISGFIGLRPLEIIKEWLENTLNETQTTSSPAIKDDKEEKIYLLIEEYTLYAQQKGIRLNSDESNVRRVINGLFENEKKYGEKYCPCRRVSQNKEENSKNICPCLYHLEEIEKDGRCFCGLFTK